jgi:hypothetical protein
MHSVIPALRTTLRAMAAAYGYALTIAATMGLLTSVEGSPGSGQLFVFVAGGLLGFAVLELALLALPEPSGDPQSAFPFAGALNAASVGAALGAATATAHAIHGTIAWGVTALVATVVFLVVVSLQVAFVDQMRTRKRRP